MRIDLNSDLAEGPGRWELGDDDTLLGIVTSANVACGSHAADPCVLRRACLRAAENGVAIGAQVRCRELAGAGHRFCGVPLEDLVSDVIYQLGALAAFASVAGTKLAYVKPHGALYAIAHQPERAAALVEAVLRYDPGLAVLGLPGSEWLRQAEGAGLRVHREAFADRAYTPLGALVPRHEPGAVLHDPEQIAARCLRMVRGEPIEAVDGSMITIAADSLCVHGDSSGAVEVAKAVRGHLVTEGVELAAFA